MMNGTGHTILLVEDEEAVLLALGNVLEREGYTVLKATNGKEGLDVALEKHPDVILSDLRLPIMSGMEMIAELRKDAWGKKAEIIILTNVSNPETLDQAMSNETFFYIVKGDSTLDQVVEKVEARIKAHSSEV